MKIFLVFLIEPLFCFLIETAIFIFSHTVFSDNDNVPAICIVRNRYYFIRYKYFKFRRNNRDEIRYPHMPFLFFFFKAPNAHIYSLFDVRVLSTHDGL